MLTGISAIVTTGLGSLSLKPPSLLLLASSLSHDARAKSLSFAIVYSTIKVVPAGDTAMAMGIRPSIFLPLHVWLPLIMPA
jgi:hypothetical protein